MVILPGCGSGFQISLEPDSGSGFQISLDPDPDPVLALILEQKKTKHLYI